MSRVFAHLIVGSKPEPFLGAMLQSIADAAQMLCVNENSGLGEDAPNLFALENSRFAKEGRMRIDRTPFADFSTARNICMALADGSSEDWALFIDADEVHWPRFAAIAAGLPNVAPDLGFIDGYTWHFFKSFDWYTSIERRMMAHRLGSNARWEGVVHEQLRGVNGRRFALPYVYAHYGNVMPFSEDARKGAQYSGLGAHGTPLTIAQAQAADVHGDFSQVEPFFADWWRVLLRYRGEHPPAARPIIAELRRVYARQFAAVDQMVRRHQPPSIRARNAFMKVNYEQRWRLRAIPAAFLGRSAAK